MSQEAHAGETASPTPDDAGEEELRRQGDRIAALLEDVHALAAAPVWQRVEELVQCLMQLYGAGLGRLLAIAAAGNAIDNRLRDGVTSDPLLSSLLALHGLHPVPTAERVRRAAEAVCEKLGRPASVLEEVQIQGGAAVLRLGAGGGPELATALDRVIRDVAPELVRVQVEAGHAGGGVPAREALVQIDLRRSRGGRAG